MTVEEVKRVQREAGLLDVHLVYLSGPDGDPAMRFWCAHTQEERDNGTVKLTQDAPTEDGACDLHRWLVTDARPNVLELEGGYYIVTPHQPDAYSEPYHADPWDFFPVNPCARCGWARTCGEPPGEDCHS
jgi:hypothetical protein